MKENIYEFKIYNEGSYIEVTATANNETVYRELLDGNLTIKDLIAKAKIRCSEIKETKKHNEYVKKRRCA